MGLLNALVTLTLKPNPDGRTDRLNRRDIGPLWPEFNDPVGRCLTRSPEPLQPLG